MFGINISDVIDNAPQIIEGHYNEFTHREDELYESRIKICKECPLLGHNALGNVCDAKKCLDTVNNKLVLYPGKNIVCGCGCRIESALRTPSKKCVLGKW